MKTLTINTNLSFRGSCVTDTLCAAFNLPLEIIVLAANLIKIKNIEYHGATFFECKRLVNLLGNYLNYRVKYIPNKAGINYEQLAILFTDHKYIVLFDEHISYLHNHEIVDGFFEKDQLIKVYPTGWWELK